ncbi:ABC transporter ATP-binding protein [Nesterenkonia alkaliphila]|uniref:ATP-binding cassette domain-containing protein n=1 Tax=Nesterenkonia alkaliphila TaxID=1463631 RepID=A0A7K1UJE0_9MICC|nr:ABC transporter ATP-binding protein [Nesterenkonia alkaliphila]MVT26589.1 ATP-binding cassette domain-containing protein [Nesterenkonia alkaliphila]GFZ78677.1 spermidine/putrescine ABC transporter ATP-binding protein [Nesterenkonia alkaliphila]
MTEQNAGELELSQLVKIYDPASELRAVDGLSLRIAAGEFVTLLGPSGCGKTTVLRTVAGFETPTSGSLTLDGKNLLRLAPSRRPVSMVFQSYALFPHMTVRENVGYGLKAAGVKSRELTERVDQALATMNLTPYADRAPAQLSGGQQQRVALARAMVTRPQVMLFDEPLSNLDAALREQMRLEIRRLQRQLGTTALYVTHDQAEAMAMSDRVVVMNSGRIEQAGPPTEIYRRPASRFVAGFVGRANFFEVQRQQVDESSAEIQLWGASYRVPAHSRTREAREVVLLVRPESLRLVPDAAAEGPAAAVVSAAVFMGDRVEYELSRGEQRLMATVMDPAEAEIIPEGSRVRMDLVPERSWLLPA